MATANVEYKFSAAGRRLLSGIPRVKLYPEGIFAFNIKAGDVYIVGARYNFIIIGNG